MEPVKPYLPTKGEKVYAVLSRTGAEFPVTFIGMEGDKFAVKHLDGYYSVDEVHKEPRGVREPTMPEDGSPWVPHNGEKIQYSNDDPRASVLTWSECWYIGKDRGDHVVRIREYSDYISTSMIRPYQKTQVTLAELLSVYASVKGLTQDGVELKPEN